MIVEQTTAKAPPVTGSKWQGERRQITVGRYLRAPYRARVKLRPRLRRPEDRESPEILLSPLGPESRLLLQSSPPSLGVPARAPGVKVSSPASVFEKLLRSFETGGFTYAYVLTDLKRLLEANASPTQLLEVLARRQSIEPLPQDAYVEIFALLDDAAARIAAEAASAAEATSADADTPPVKIPETTPAPIEPAPPTPRTRPSIAQAKSTQMALRSVFERVLSVFETSGFTDFEVLSQLKRLLLATGASPTMLLEALRRRQLFEPLPEHAHAKVLGLLNEVLGQTEAQIQVLDMAEQARGPFPTPGAIAASPGSRSPAEVSTAAVTAARESPAEILDASACGTEPSFI